MLILLAGQLMFVFSASAAEEMKITITPPLIKNNVEKGQTWSSVIKVTNNTLSDLPVYTQVMDFKSREDGAGPQFITEKNDAESNQFLASSWVNIEAGPINIPAQESVEIPFVIKVPADASPGGHYAAILIGNQSSGEVAGTAIKISSQVSSLLFLSVKGEVVERGDIREFSTDKNVYQEAHADLTVRFENTGNVHLQPQGEIGIYNIFGKQVEKFLVNQSSGDYGNVLPASIRKWIFTWDGSKSPFSMGRYRADLILSYGNQSKETKNASLFFWVINYKWLGIIIGSLLLIILLIQFLIKRYIKKALADAKQFSAQIEKETVNNQSINNQGKTVDLRSGQKK